MKRPKKAPPAPALAPRTGRPLLTVVLVLGGAAGVLFGLSLLGDEARRSIGPRDRYAVPFAEVRCEPPPGVSRETFLTEVRYNSNVPAELQLLDQSLKAQLANAFAAHPWVQSVDSVTVEPPNTVAVALTFRKPVLCVKQRAGNRIVDIKGVLLPLSAPTNDLPELRGAPELSPDALAGQFWPSDVVVRAAPVAAEYKPKTLTRTQQGWELLMPDGRKLLVTK